jgi:hypothetical protein
MPANLTDKEALFLTDLLRGGCTPEAAVKYEVDATELSDKLIAVWQHRTPKEVKDFRELLKGMKK